MAWFVDAQNYSRTIRDPESGEEAQVTLRPLNAGDRAMLEDTVQLQAESGDPQVLLGTMKRLTVERAVVDWTLPLAATPETLRSLHPDVFEQIFSFVSFGSVPAEPEEESDPLESATESEEAPVAVAS